MTKELLKRARQLTWPHDTPHDAERAKVIEGLCDEVEGLLAEVDTVRSQRNCEISRNNRNERDLFSIASAARREERAGLLRVLAVMRQDVQRVLDVALKASGGDDEDVDVMVHEHAANTLDALRARIEREGDTDAEG